MKEQAALASWGKNIIIIDNSELPESSRDPMLAFALDELLCKQAAEHNVAFCHIWRHPNAFILGQQDARLPHAQAAIDWLSSLHYMPIVRNSGGAAVPLDQGVVNLSLIFPLSHEQHRHFHDDFEKMVELIATALTPFRAAVDKGEVAGGYCPGDFDLSINGLKFCGIAQRRQLRAYCVQAFVNASGSGSQRASLVRRFYELAGKDTKPDSYPLVIDDRTASLEELLQLGQHAHYSFITAIKQTLVAQGSVNAKQSVVDSPRQLAEQSPGDPSESFIMPGQAQIAAMAKQLNERYGKL